jgi:hypothetical protein
VWRSEILALIGRSYDPTSANFRQMWGTGDRRQER